MSGDPRALRSTLIDHPEQWKCVAEYIKMFQSGRGEERNAGTLALTQLWENGWGENQEWNPGFSSMAGLPHDVYEVHLIGLRDLLQHFQKREWSAEGESTLQLLLVLLIASIRSDFEKIIPNNFLPLLEEVNSCALDILEKRVEAARAQGCPSSWLFLTQVSERNWPVLIPFILRLFKVSNDYAESAMKVFWSKNAEALKEIAMALIQLCIIDSDEVNLELVEPTLTQRIKFGEVPHSLFAYGITKQFKTLSYPWTASLSRTLGVFFECCDEKPLRDDDDGKIIVAMLEKMMYGITSLCNHEEKGVCQSLKHGDFILFCKCVEHFPSAVFRYASDVSWFLAHTTSVEQVISALKYVVAQEPEEPARGNTEERRRLSPADIRALIKQSIETNRSNEGDCVQFIGFLLDPNNKKKLTLDSALAILKMFPRHSSDLAQLFGGTIQLLTQLVTQFGLTTLDVRLVLDVARWKMGSQWALSSLAEFESDIDRAHAFTASSNKERVCQHKWFKESSERTCLTLIEREIFQLINTALQFSKALSQAVCDVLTEVPVLIITHYLDTFPEQEQEQHEGRNEEEKVHKKGEGEPQQKQQEQEKKKGRRTTRAERRRKTLQRQ